MANGDTLELIHHKAEDLRRKQDSKLQRLLRLATTTPVVVLSAGTVAVAVPEDLAAPAAVVVFGAVIALGIILFAVEAFAAGWKEGPGINEHLEALRDRRPTSQQLQFSMVVTLGADHAHNSRILNSVRRLVILQGLIALAGLATLLLTIRELA
ncbi:hypothetical protein [Candidatus Poriferisocius sp.]|uniref:hypothetical protein n=1 Tax=Candidatus Poriferisocius sp. TaxID=3101276 RepID=UPI003B021C11